MPLHMTSSFAAVIISTATWGRHLTINVNMGRNRLLAQWTFIVVYGRGLEVSICRFFSLHLEVDCRYFSWYLSKTPFFGWNSCLLWVQLYWKSWLYVMQFFTVFHLLPPPQTLQELLQHGLYHMQQYYEWNQTARQCSTRAADLDNTTVVGWALLTGLLSPVTPCQPWVCSALRRTTEVKVKLMVQSNPQFVCSCLIAKLKSFALDLLKFTPNMKLKLTNSSLIEQFPFFTAGRIYLFIFFFAA